VNHCSGHGVCSGPNVCTCHSGYKGINCSESILAPNISLYIFCYLSVALFVTTFDRAWHDLTLNQVNFLLFLVLTVSCESLNNCSNYGACTGPNECTCEIGFQGREDCSKGTKTIFRGLDADVQSTSHVEPCILGSVFNYCITTSMQYSLFSCAFGLHSFFVLCPHFSSRETWNSATDQT